MSGPLTDLFKIVRQSSDEIDYLFKFTGVQQKIIGELMQHLEDSGHGRSPVMARIGNHVNELVLMQEELRKLRQAREDMMKE